MKKFLRKNAWNNEGTFDNPDLFWYAKAVAEMQSRKLDDPTSWWFFAAIHGENIAGDPKEGIDWNTIKTPPKVPTSPIPSASIKDKYWNQCQHQSYYFAPWHRGYLMALEIQIRAIVIQLNGPKDWSLPYWNYFGGEKENKIPPAFTQQLLADNTPNPLFVTERHGPDNDGNIYIKLFKDGKPRVTQNCELKTVYTGKLNCFGGPETEFSHYGTLFPEESLETNPHNFVHNDVGGVTVGNEGIMSDPNTAALDPIFYLHHCNIDRMWASWNAKGNSNPSQTEWLGGPKEIGEREFVMPWIDGKEWVYTPNDVTDLNSLDYSYDDLKTKTEGLLADNAVQRLKKLGIPIPESIQLADDTMDNNDKPTELVGANQGSFEIKNEATNTKVNFSDKVLKKVSKSFLKASAQELPDRIYLVLENVKGNVNANTLEVTVNDQHAGFISLFGLRNASLGDSHGGRNGLSFSLDITNIIDELHLENDLDTINSLDIAVTPDNEILADAKITVGRVSIYREKQ
ncbi:tyrosinase family protein [Chryseobacterium sp. LC2016-27]|jgi:tyrosinase|uniref:tyrosinase family protein n=1 Tax=Chryseobacterium sp. LC2016-27 TaxID=2897326 RepID=UPI001E317C1E|nr:tyrosinase family protein [Chryseobacterium sp. LC2016-27]MCD0456837.1 tyrosinase family protein [Chryseobacterium sp. LC2016-27]